MSVKMSLCRFALRAAGGYRGRDGGDDFVRELLEAFGQWPDTSEVQRGYELSIVDNGKKKMLAPVCTLIRTDS
jgi:hypothetical protein